jgi:probable F420-dependent oxidoreductase
MKVAIGCAGIGAKSTGDFIRRSAQAAERHGFGSFWLPEHVVRFDAYPESKHPYAGVFDNADPPADPRREPYADPVVGMTWAAAATTTIEIGSAIIILPQRNPVILGKEMACLDQFSGGRVALGVGSGWCKEEFDAVGADWINRGARTDEYIDAMRSLWRMDRAQFQGETISFRNACMYPKPLRNSDIPILVGGESEAALKRVARAGDGWLALNLPVKDASRRIAQLKQLTRARGRDPDSLRIMCPILETTSEHDLKRYREAGGTEFYLLVTSQIPIEEEGLNAHMAALGVRYVETVKDW